MSPKNVDRMQRIGDLMHRTIATLLREEFKDPRIGLVTVVSVDVARDLSFAKVYISVLEETKVQQTLTVLNNAAGFFRGHLSKACHLKIVPKLKFIFDDSVQRGARVESLLNEHKENFQNNDPFSKDDGA